MVKFARFTLILIVLLGLTVPLTASAQPDLQYETGIQIQNNGNDTADIIVTYYNQDGTIETQINGSIPAGGSITYFPLDALPTGFDGSATIAADQPVAVISNMLLTEAGGELWAFGGASYRGFEVGATRLSLPLIMKANGNFTTWFNLQNLSSEAANVTVTYSEGSSEVATIPPRGALTFDPATNPDLPPGFVGSAVVTSDQPVAATVVELGATTVFAYNGFSKASTRVAMPLMNFNSAGYITGIQIQNVGDTPSDVTVTYTPSMAGTACTETKTIQPNGSATFALYAFAFQNDPDPGTSDCPHGELFIGSAAVSANSAEQPLVGIVNQLNLGANKGAAYTTFDPADATDTVHYPLIMDRNSNYWTGYSVVNVGDSETTVTCSYSGGIAHQDSGLLQPGEALTVLNLDTLGEGYVGSATCVADSGGLIVGICNEVNTVLSGDAFLVYNGFNQ